MSKQEKKRRKREIDYFKHTQTGEKRTWTHYNFISSVFNFFPRIQLANHLFIPKATREHTWQLLNKFIIRLDARVGDSAEAPCFFQYIRAAIYSLQIVPNWQPGRHARVRTTFVQPSARTHTKSRLMGASTNDTPSSLTGWLSAHPLINWLHAPRPCVHRCNTRVYSQMYIRYNLPCSRFEHPCFSFIKRRFNCKSIPSQFPRIRDGAPMTFGQPVLFLLLPRPLSARTCMQRYIRGVSFQRVGQRLG